MPADGVRQPILAPFFVRGVHGLADAVGEGDQHVAVRERDASGRIVALVHQADHRPAGVETHHLAAALPEHHRRVVPAIHVGQQPVAGSNSP